MARRQRRIALALLLCLSALTPLFFDLETLKGATQDDLSFNIPPLQPSTTYPTRTEQQKQSQPRCDARPPENLPSHACRIHKPTQMVYCRFQNLRIDIHKVDCSIGGENLTEMRLSKKGVHGMPVYQPGAFTISKELDNPLSELDWTHAHYIKDVLKAIVVEANQTCTTTISTPSLLITRYEYANLYHTMTDFFNAYMTLQTLANQTDTQIIFLDGHVQGHLDQAWPVLFGNVTRVKQLPGNNTVCLESTVLIPPGYSAPIWSRHNRHIRPCPEMMEEFVQFVLSKFHLEQVQMIPGKVTIIERVPYVAFPWIDLTKANRIIDNLEDLKVELNTLDGVQAELVRFEEHSFREQLERIRQSQILIGNHGAGLAHLLFLARGAHVMEFQDSASGMFVEFASWKEPSIQYHSLPTVGRILPSSAIQAVVDEVKGILQK